MGELCYEMLRVVLSLVRKEGKTMIKEKGVGEFPREFYWCVCTEKWFEMNAKLKYVAVVLAGEILLVLTREMGVKDKNLLKKWKVKVKELHDHTKGEAEKQELNSLILALDKV